MKLALAILFSVSAFATQPVLLIGGKGTGSTAASTTIYSGLGDGVCCSASTPTTGTEAEGAAPFRTAGTLSRMWVKFTTYDRGTGTATMRTATTTNGNETFSITGTGITADTTHTDSVAGNGDLWDVEIVTGSGGTTSVIRSVGALFTPTSNSIAKWGGFNPQTYSTASNTYLQTVAGGWDTGTPGTEVSKQSKIRTAGTWRNMWAYASANTRVTDNTLASHINGSTGNLLVTITALMTGLFVDNTHTDSIAASDLLSMQLSIGTGAATSTTLSSYGSSFETTNNQIPLVSVNAAAAGFTVSASANGHTPIGGAGNSSTEADMQIDPQTGSTLSSMDVNVLTNGVTATSTFTLRKGAADTALLISFASGATGFSADTTHSVSVVATDLINYRMAAGGSGTTMTYNLMSVISAPTSANSRRFIRVNNK